jgi:signal transduction histidine kinase
VVSESAPMVLSDKDKLGISLYQIIQNALKYSGEEMVTVCIEQKADRVIISVTDKGNGMDREIQQKIFQPFYQNDTSTTRKYDGTGLGLFIANSFINMLKGSVNCRSESGPGTIISIDLPVLYS